MVFRRQFKFRSVASEMTGWGVTLATCSPAAVADDFSRSRRAGDGQLACVLRCDADTESNRSIRVRIYSVHLASGFGSSEPWQQNFGHYTYVFSGFVTREKSTEISTGFRVSVFADFTSEKKLAGTLPKGPNRGRLQYSLDLRIFTGWLWDVSYK